MGLDPKAVGEAAYRLAINPTPPLRNIIMTDDQFSSLLPLWCRYDHMSGTNAKLLNACCLSRRSALAGIAFFMLYWQLTRSFELLKKVIFGIADRCLL